MFDTELAESFAAAAEELAAGTARTRDGDGGASDGFDARAWAAAAEAGWFDVLRAEDAGGLGLGLLELSGVFRAAGRHLFAGPLLEHAVVLPMLLSAAPELRAEWESRSDAGTPSVALVDPVAVGQPPIRLTGMTLDGAADAVVHTSTTCDLIVVATDDSGQEKVALIPADRAGVTVQTRDSLDPSVSYARVEFVDVDVADGELVDDAQFDSVRDSMRVMIACDAWGSMEEGLRLSVEHAKVREQYGAPIGSFQAVQEMLAEMARRTVVVQSICRAALQPSQRGRAPFGLDALAAKAAVAAHARPALEDALQVHGGIAFTVEHHLHRYYLRVLRLQDLYGTRRELSRRIGVDLLAAGADPWPR